MFNFKLKCMLEFVRIGFIDKIDSARKCWVYRRSFYADFKIDFGSPILSVHVMFASYEFNSGFNWNNIFTLHIPLFKLFYKFHTYFKLKTHPVYTFIEIFQLGEMFFSKFTVFRAKKKKILLFLSNFHYWHQNKHISSRHYFK